MIRDNEFSVMGDCGVYSYFISGDVYDRLMRKILTIDWTTAGDSLSTAYTFIPRVIFFPINFSEFNIYLKGETSSILYKEMYVGNNQSLGLSGYQVIQDIQNNPSSVEHIGISIDMGTFSFPDIYNDFRDYSPYTHISVYLPFLGYYDLPDFIIKYPISVIYVPNLYTGDLLCEIKCNINNNWVIVKEITGKIGIDLCVGGSNASQISINQLFAPINTISNVYKGALTGAFLGGGKAALAGGILGIANSAKETLDNQLETGYCTPIGCGGINGYNGKNVIFYLHRNTIDIPTNYAKTYGFPAQYTSKLKNLNGFTIVSNPHLEGNGFNFCLEEEKKEIEKILTTGFLLDDVQTTGN